MNTSSEISVAPVFPKMHVSLNVANIENAVLFYETFFGEKAHKRRPGYANFSLNEPPLKLSLQEATVSEGTGKLSHLGIQFENLVQVTAAKARLIEAKLATFDEGDTVCCFARQDKLWVHDPDGNAWEVYALLDEMNEFEDDHFGGHDVPTVGNACCVTPPSRADISFGERVKS